MKEKPMEERWIPPGSKCDLCKRSKRKDERWWDTHTNCGIGGFTFNFCTECEKDRQNECDEVMAKVLSDHRKRVKEYWDTHREELAKYNHDLAEYRKNCLDVDRFPKKWSRTWQQRLWNWLRKMVGYRRKYRHYMSPDN